MLRRLLAIAAALLLPALAFTRWSLSPGGQEANSSCRIGGERRLFPSAARPEPAS